MRDKAEILTDLENLLVEYMQAGTELQSLMLDGFVIKARAVDAEHLENRSALGITIWIAPESQDVFKSLGLANALTQDVETYYAALFGNSEALDNED